MLPNGLGLCYLLWEEDGVIFRADKAAVEQRLEAQRLLYRLMRKDEWLSRAVSLSLTF